MTINFYKIFYGGVFGEFCVGLTGWGLLLGLRVNGERVRDWLLFRVGPDDWEPLVNAARLMDEGGCLNRTLCRCYTLIGYPKDTIEDAERRLIQVLRLGMFPMAMLYRDERGETGIEWRRFQRLWARPAIIAMRAKELMA